MATNQIPLQGTRISLKNSLIFMIFVGSLVPLTIDTAQAGFFVSYYYVLLLVLPFIRFRFSNTGLTLLSIYTLIFVAGIFKMFNGGFYYSIRVTLSYVVFILPLLLIFIKIEDSYFEKFKKAIIWVAVGYSLWMMLQLASIGYSGDFYNTKDLMGSNRFGFVIIFAFFILLYEEDYGRMFKIILLTTLVIGLTLTFSRSSIVAFVAAVFVMVAMNLRRIKLSYIVYTVLFGAVLFVVFRETVIGAIVEFFGQYLLGYEKYGITNSRTSEGYRVYVFKQIMTYVVSHPIFGSNFAGIFLLYPEYGAKGGSAHSQYTDVLLRTGIVGFSLYMYVLYRMTMYYRRISKGIFFGLVGILVYGLFHETFKLAHGSFIFAILLSYFLYNREPARKLKITADDLPAPVTDNQR